MKDIVLIVTVIISLLVFNGCGNDASNGKNTDRFVKIDKNVYYDTETGVEYFYGNDLTVLIDKDGKPLIYNKNNK